MPRVLDSVVFFVTFALGTATLAACTHALVKRNEEVGAASRTAALTGANLILSTNNLTMPGYALSTASCGILVNALILFVHNFHIIPMSKFQRKIFFLTPLLLLLNTLLAIGSAVAVTYVGRNGRITAYLTLHGVHLPQSVFDSQASALGLAVYYWGKPYVKFMSIIPWAMIPFAIVTTYLAYKYWLIERPSAQHNREEEGGMAPVMSSISRDEKATTEHVA